MAIKHYYEEDNSEVNATIETLRQLKQSFADQKQAFLNSDGRANAYIYTGKDPKALEVMAYREAYAVITCDDETHLEEMRIHVYHPSDASLFSLYGTANFLMVGKIDDYFRDVYGLVNPDSAHINSKPSGQPKRMLNGLHYVDQIALEEKRKQRLDYFVDNWFFKQAHTKNFEVIEEVLNYELAIRERPSVKQISLN